ncbi:hypothetical protein ISG33_10070 [Glaciecola sp. MH2013]|uniref:right-handed parallel beta-helix repeat-containing protein n=1 Tax=Glaciecola sp. MH2013 TaxID=2785524 RepID=UPI0018A00690|nr:right-handed parallel beta-helix repeat-containing protein [Glaciecola sp. MH2013]MBF7073742.1 hypothetical protein [Glaciecola sp. MH2013]
MWITGNAKRRPFSQKVILVVAGLLVSSLSQAATYVVDTVAELRQRLENAQNGDVIKIDGNGGNSGVYTYTGSTYNLFTLDGWINTAPMFLINDVSNVTIEALNPSVKPTLKGKGLNNNYVFYGQEVNGITIRNIKFTNSRKGVIIDRSNNIRFDNNDIFDIGEEAFHLRDGSDNAVISNNRIYNTGLIRANRGEAIYICNDRKKWNIFYQPSPVESDYRQNCDFAHIFGNTVGPNVGNNGVDVKEGTVGVYVENNTFNLAWTRSELLSSSNPPDVVVHLKGTQGVAHNNTFNFANAPSSLTRAVSVDAQLDDDPSLALIHGYNNWAVNNTVLNANANVYVFRAKSDGGAKYGCNTGAPDRVPSARPERVYEELAGTACTPPNAPTAGGGDSGGSGSDGSGGSGSGSGGSSGGGSSDPSGPSGFTYAGNENTTINVSNAVDIAYGADGSFVIQENITNNISCSNATFGDPIPGTFKACFTRPANADSGNNDGDCFQYSGRQLTEITLNSASCVVVSGGLSNKEIAIADSDANTSCNIRGSANSADGNGTRVIDGNWEKITGGWSGTRINFTVSNNCPYLKLRVRNR